jgi:hypothetical protein
VVAERMFVEEEPGFYSETLDELFEIFMKAKEIEGLRERTLADHEKHFRYFKDFLVNTLAIIGKKDGMGGKILWL